MKTKSLCGTPRADNGICKDPNDHVWNKNCDTCIKCGVSYEYYEWFEVE